MKPLQLGSTVYLRHMDVTQQETQQPLCFSLLKQETFLHHSMSNSFASPAVVAPGRSFTRGNGKVLKSALRFVLFPFFLSFSMNETVRVKQEVPPHQEYAFLQH